MGKQVHLDRGGRTTVLRAGAVDPGLSPNKLVAADAVQAKEQATAAKAAEGKAEDLAKENEALQARVEEVEQQLKESFDKLAVAERGWLVAQTEADKANKLNEELQEKLSAALVEAKEQPAAKKPVKRRTSRKPAAKKPATTKTVK